MRYILCIIVTMSLGLLSCGGGKEDEPLLGSIERTWQLCETSLPDALARAEMLRDSVQASSEYVRHRYDLLTIRLRDKLDMIPSSPDSALQVVSYFENRPGAASDRERSYYYAGSAYRDLKDYPRAVCLFLKATDAAEQAEEADTLIWQNALSQLRFLYMMLLNYEEELNVALRSVKLSRQSGQNLGCYLMDVSSAYRHLNDTAQCLLYCDQAYNVIRGEHFPPRYGRILASMLLTYSDYNRYDKTGMLLRHLSQMGAEQRPHNYELCLARYYENRNQNDSAIAHYIIYYNTAEEATGRYEASAGLQRCYLQRKDYRSAAEWGQRLYATNDTITSLRAFEQTQRARDEYRYFRDKEAEQAIVQRNEALA